MKEWMKKNWLSILKMESILKNSLKSLSKKKFVKRRKSSILQNKDLKALAKLTSTGIPFNTAINIIKNNNNKKIFESIQNELSKGKSSSLVFSKYLNNYLKEHFLLFEKNLSFSDSLLLSLRLEEERNSLLKIIVKKLTYPLGLFLVSFFGIFIFNNYFFDSLMKTLTSFAANVNYLYTIKTATDILINLILVVLLVFLVIILWLSQKRNIIFGYYAINKYLKENIFKRYITNEFIVYFKEMYKVGLSTRLIFETLRKLKDNPILSNLSYKINELLLEGKTFEEAITTSDIDESFNYFVVLIEKSSDVAELLDDYAEVNKDYFIDLINKTTRIIQIVSYSFVIFFIFFIYQIILSPLNMLSGI